MTPIVHAPLGGVVIDVEDVPDPVFAGAIIGPGFAILPDDEERITEVRAPVSGLVSAFHPHAFVISAEGEAPVLVHLGIDTVDLKGEGFTAFASEDEPVRQGDPLVEWDLSIARAADLLTVVPVIALSPAARVTRMVDAGARVEAGEPVADFALG
ncbi:PTS sugar transporter subunit IIA [Schaalia hyovaginalis]|uniref:PTS sugar transporter subunit IIA n=1 Tax=Schaalia hyovaginalis TaxID=29316 RepID=UPI0012B3E5BB|nr:PTS glucose transporter subunit IIA [Schaalia hyovaginalis]MST64433.1 PTS glucose transporter subunit IIA [Schaalia hyovaginalis]